MRAKLVAPFESLHGKLDRDFYARVMYGKQIIQRCPRRWKPPTEKQLEARRKFAEKYAGRGKAEENSK
jgi:hypothetical protein